MTILVTGAAGFIGSELCLRLLERGDQVVGLDIQGAEVAVQGLLSDISPLTVKF